MYAAVLCFASLLAKVIARGSVIDNDVSKTLEVKTGDVVWRAGDRSGTAEISTNGDARATLDGNGSSGSVSWSSGGKSGDVKWRESGDGSATWTVLSEPGKLTGSVKNKKSSKIDSSGLKTGDKAGGVSWGGGSHSGSAKWQGDGSGSVTWGGKGSGSGQWSKDGGFVQWNGGFVRWGKDGAGKSWWGTSRGGSSETPGFAKW
ncbi:hypothetical protein CHS0354_034911 [Potamilus streckersoni]|uniref:Uncharacterized protein n=1 Tax=Potamilus streckersoni TaxID=2493646 RepID=A0AAE0SDH2_9BIVA|nr:hypothetical protein CHS0354_034911 [Potamilus streckersoni]